MLTDLVLENRKKLPQLIDQNAIEVIRFLSNAGFKAYVVGGAIRDILLGNTPKDFDVVTNATPQEIHKTIRHSRIIGRRFKLVHAYFGREIIEVATFRGGKSEKNEKGVVVADNNFSQNIEDDVIRRDFTVNSLYYDVLNDELIDLKNGLNDLKKGAIKVIGEPMVRFQEDPVRILRALVLVGKLGLKLNKNIEKAIYSLKHLLFSVSPARFAEEFFKIVYSKKSVAIFDVLMNYDLFSLLFPDVYKVIVKNKNLYNFVRQCFQNTDTRLTNGSHANQAFSFTFLLWPVVISRFSKKFFAKKVNFKREYRAFIDELISKQSKTIVIPKFVACFIEGVLLLQYDFREKKPLFKVERGPGNSKMRAAFDFFKLREEFSI